MSIDYLQQKIRKLKNPSVISFALLPEHIPPCICERDSYFVSAYEYFCSELLHGLKDTVPAVRFSLGMLSIYGPDGLVVLGNLLRTAKELGYYVLLDGPAVFSRQDCTLAADRLLQGDSGLVFDGLVADAYIGSDGIKPYVDLLGQTDKDLFVLLRTANRSAAELQDLQTGSRLMHIAAADVVKRYSPDLVGSSGYSQLAAVASASSAEGLRNLRSKYKEIFLLLDGYDYPNANAKNCSFAFDRLGHGAVACAGLSVTAAWQEEPGDEREFVSLAAASADRMRKNLTRYVTIL